MNENENDVLPDHLRTALNAIINRPLPRIQEEDFVKYFLAGFAGKLDKVPVVNWLDVAGNAMSEVEVCKGDEVLFVVPPIFGSTFFEKTGGQANSIGEIVAHAQKLNRVHPTQGERFLQEALNHRVNHADEDFKTIRQMNAIFKRYGLEEIKLPEPKTGVSQEVQSNDKPVIHGFEEL